MSKYNEEMQQQLDIAKSKQEALLNEEYVIVINIASQPNILRLTYSSYKKGRIKQIDELDASEQLISTSTFKGLRCEGFCSSDIKEIKVLLHQLKPKDYQANKEMIIEQYYKNN